MHQVGVKTLGGSQLKERLAARKATGGRSIKANRFAKSAAQLEEEERKRKQLDDEIEEMARREKERWIRFKKMFTPPDVISIIKKLLVDKLKVALNRLCDKEGRLISLFDEFDIISKSEKWKIIHWWNELDNFGKNRVRYDRFCRYLKFALNPWSRRLFDIIDTSLKGSISLVDFLEFSLKYLLIDKDMTQEFSFRMISRRGNVFKRDFSVIDLEDMRLFIKDRYKIKEPKRLYKTALDVFEYVDSDGDGGLYVDEFYEFNESNPVFVRYTHCYQQHIRKCIFGIPWWVEKSRIIKSKKSKGFASMSLLSRQNLLSERYTMNELKDSVVDAKGRPLNIQPWVDNNLFENESALFDMERETKLNLMSTILMREEVVMMNKTLFN